MMQTREEILAVAQASTARRVLGIGMLGFLGGMLIYMALTSTPTLGWRIFLVGVGALAIVIADKMRRATATRIELTETELRDSDGTVIARIEDIVSMDRGFFAFKPSNGFLLRVSNRAERVWRPGLWWRVGRRIGVGGMTPARQTKMISEIIAVKLALRAGV